MWSLVSIKMDKDETAENELTDMQEQKSFECLHDIDLHFYYSSGIVNSLVQVEGTATILTIGSDRSIRIWKLRDSGKYMPSTYKFLSRNVLSLHYHQHTRKVFVGLDKGVISEFKLPEDFNQIEHVKDYQAHKRSVTGIYYSSEKDWILSCSEDKKFKFHSTQSGNVLGEHNCNFPCTTLEYDEANGQVFVGNQSGEIIVFKLNTDHGITFSTILKCHSGKVQSLCWDAQKQYLYSGSSDHNIYIWEITTPKELGSPKPLTDPIHLLYGHNSTVMHLQLLKLGKHLLSIGADGKIVIWDMTKTRKNPSVWLDSNTCELCNKPFFWNIPDMYEQHKLGVRQHHCRNCGKAVCNECSPNKCVIPLTGFEIPVRVCKICNIEINEGPPKPLCLSYNLSNDVRCIDYDDSQGILVTIGSQEIMRVHKVKFMV